MRRTLAMIALLAAPGLALSACSGGKAPAEEASSGAPTVAEEAAVVPAKQTVPDVLDDTDGLQTMAEALKETGIASTFEGNGSYTLLAPEDDAFARLGDAGKQLTASDDHAALAALIKDHLLPGYITPQDISAAIDASKDGEVSMASVGGGKVTFAKANGKITATAADGSTANFDGSPVAGGSSIAIPIDGVLKKV